MASTNLNEDRPAAPSATTTLSEKTPVASVQPVASKTSPAPKTAPAGKIPPGYEIIRVQKPDGTIIKVKRPIKKQAAPGAAVLPAKGSQTTSPAAQISAKTTSVASSTPATQPSKTSPIAQNPTKGEATAEQPKTTSDVTQPAPTGNTAQPGSKREAAINSYNIFNRLRRIRNRGAQVARVFDPSGDYGIFEDGDIELEPDDDYDDNDDDNDDEDDDEDTERSTDTPQNGQATTSDHQVGIPGNIQVQNGAAPQTAVRATPPAPATTKSQPRVTEKELKPKPNATSDNAAKNAVDGEKSLPPRSRVLMPYGTHWTRWIIWIITLVLPLLFIVLGIIVACLKDTDGTSKIGKGVDQATKAAVTLWPILFAAVVAQSLRALATYKVERGIRVMTLEQLIGSHSVASAIKQPFLLRKPDLLTLGLTALWALSPLASQAMQRWLSQVPGRNDGTHSLSYLDTTRDSYGLQLVNYVNNQSQWWQSDNYLAPMDELFMAAFLHQNNSGSSLDPWGNILIPQYPNIASTPALPTDWTDVTFPVYSSLFGIPDYYNNIIDIGDHEFYLNSSYLEFDCPSINVTTLDALDSGGLFNFADLNTTDAEVSDRALDPLQDNAGATRLWPSDGGTLWLGMTPLDRDAGNIHTFFFLSQNTDGAAPVTGENQTAEQYSYAVCTIRQEFVESKVKCVANSQQDNCSVESMRKIPIEPTNYDMLAVDLVRASGVGGNDLSFTAQTMMERYIMSPENITSVNDFINNISKVPIADFTERLSKLVNTFYVSSFAPAYITSQIPENCTVDVYDGNDDIVKAKMSIMTHTTAHFAYTNPYQMHYVVHYEWVAIFLFCSVILLVFGVANVLWESQTLAPDILGFASSVARQSRNVKLPKTESAMTGAERARKLANSRVMFQDAWPDRPVGKIVLGPAFEGAEKLKEGRLYR